jgi:LDH2 family malate/lactate/ureidoglycolate dehydrogenase
MDRQEFTKNVTALVRKVKSTKKLPGVEEIFAPGEKESRLAGEREKIGLIDVEDNLLAALREKAAGDVGI